MTTIEAIYEGGVLRPVDPIDLDEGARVQLLLLRERRSGHRSPAEVMAEIAALPREGSDDVETASRDHDRYLYGEGTR
jgi:predicted DNA-binding antitoxin AbrB/MazE fold protein